MALLWADSFEHQDTKRYTSATINFVSTGRNGFGVRGGDVYDQVGIQQLTFGPISGDTVIWAGAIYFDDIDGIILYLKDSVGANRATLSSTGGQWDLDDFGGTAITGGTTTTGVWYWVEFKIKYAGGGAGSAELRVNGAVIGTYSGTTTSSTYPSYMQFGAISGSDIDDASLDDLVIMDGSGSRMNDFIGDSRVEMLTPNADSTINLTGSDADQVDNFDLVNETPASSTNYVGGSTVDDFDYYDVSGLSGSTDLTWEILAVQTWGYIGKESGGNAYGRLLARSSGTTSEGTIVALSSSYTYSSHTMHTQPDTSTWTQGSITNLEVGFEVTSSA